jgi:hypothetical protein
MTKLHISNKWLLGALLPLMAACTSTHRPDTTTDEVPTFEPDYAGVTFPVNIAAPSFYITSDADDYQTEIGRCGQEPSIVAKCDDKGGVTISLRKWHSLLEEAAGDSIYFRVAVKRQGKWVGMPDVVCPVSADPIDRYLAYRLIYPGYELWTEMGIYQRDLTSYDETPVLENKDLDTQCMNCHNFSANDPNRTMMLHVRGAQGGTLISHNGKVEKINSAFVGMEHGATYPATSRDGKFIAFSTNKVGQVFHSSGTKPIEVIDQGADLAVYDVERHRAYTNPDVNGTAYMETFPTWTPDGKRIYFCRGNSFSEFVPIDSFRYDLCSIDFDPTSGRLSNLQVVYDATADTMSVSFPRISPDGRWLMFTRSSYGNFSIWHPEAQLVLMDLKTGSMREIDEVNSDDIESYHCWSSTGKWFVFSSKRLDGLWARPFFAHFDPATGRCTKPLPMPQPTPEYYHYFSRTYNIPELIISPVDNAKELFNAVVDQKPTTITSTVVR